MGIGTLERITERTQLGASRLQVDRTAGVIRGARVLGLQSVNGRTYAREAVARALPLYEGAAVYVNHSQPGDANRSYHDRIGSLRSVHQVEDGGLRGDIHFNPKHTLAEQLAWDAEHAPENVGLSHNVEAKVSRKASTVLVEEIVAVRSVDIVAEPATSKGLSESVESTRETIETAAEYAASLTEGRTPQSAIDTTDYAAELLHRGP